MSFASCTFIQKWPEVYHGTHTVAPIILSFLLRLSSAMPTVNCNGLYRSPPPRHRRLACLDRFGQVLFFCKVYISGSSSASISTSYSCISLGGVLHRLTCVLMTCPNKTNKVAKTIDLVEGYGASIIEYGPLHVVS